MVDTVSVVIPLYNRLDRLTNVIESILAQTVPVLEVIVIDDGSTAHRPEMVEELIRSKPSWADKVFYHYQENKGQSVANNNGIARVRGHWIGFNADDDLWLTQKLEWQFRALREFTECSACFTDAWFMNNPHMKMTLFQLYGFDRTQLIAEVGDLKELVDHLEQVWMQTMLVKTDVVRAIGGLDPDLRFHEDQEFIFRLALQTKFCFVGLPLALIDRTPKEQRHTGKSKDWDHEDFRLRMVQSRLEKNLAACNSRYPEVQRILEHKLSDIHSGWASWHLEHNSYEEARESAQLAMRYKPNKNNILKWTLLHIGPQLTRKVVALRDRLRARRAYGIGW